MILQIINDTLGQVVNDVVNTAVAVHEATGGGQIVKGLDNGIVGSLLSLIIAGVIRHFEKRKIKRKYKKD